MNCQSMKIECVWKTPFRKSGHIYNNLCAYMVIIDTVCFYTHAFVALKTPCFQIKDIEHEGWLTKQGM